MKYEELIENIQLELDSLNIIFNDIIRFPNKSNEKINNYDKSAIALMLSQFYNGLENIFKRVLKFHNINIKNSENYHIEIIDSFNNMALEKYSFEFSAEILNTITILRRFRHYVFHGYSFNLEWNKLKIANDTISIIFPKFQNELSNLTERIENTALNNSKER